MMVIKSVIPAQAGIAHAVFALQPLEAPVLTGVSRGGVAA